MLRGTLLELEQNERRASLKPHDTVCTSVVGWISFLNKSFLLVSNLSNVEEDSPIFESSEVLHAVGP